MIKQKLFLGLAFLSCMFFLSCKGPKGDPGPTGSAGVSYNPNVDHKLKEGYIKGTAAGIMLDATSFSYDFDFEGYDIAEDNNFTSSDNSISIYKAYSGEGTTFEYGNFYINIDVTSLSDLSTPILTNLFINFSKDLGNNKLHSAYYEYYDGNSNGITATVSNLVYNSTTKILTGNYSFSAPANTEHGSMDITNGTFSTVLNTTVARKAAQ